MKRRGSGEDAGKPRGAGKRAPGAPEHDDSAAVTAYLAGLEHPLKDVVVAIRSAVLGADAGVTEGIKWKSASFYCHGWFATVNVRGKGALVVVFHHGAGVRADATLRQSIEDGAGLLEWLSADRATVPFASLGDFEGKREAFVAIVRQWAAYQREL